MAAPSPAQAALATLRAKNARHAAFALELLVDDDATAAYGRAGYKATGAGAKTNASKLRHAPDVAAVVDLLRAERAERTGVTADQVLEELARIGFSDMRRFTTWGPAGVDLLASDGLSEDAARCVAEVSQTTTQHGGSIKFKLHDKVAALTLLGKHLGLFVDKLDVTGEVKLSRDEAAERVATIMAAALRRKRGRS